MDCIYLPNTHASILTEYAMLHVINTDAHTEISNLPLFHRSPSFTTRLPSSALISYTRN